MLFDLKRCLIAGLLAFLIVTPEAFASNGPNLTTIGNKGPVSIPVYGDGFTAYRMPSSIGWARENRVDLAAFFFYSRTTFRNSQNDFTGENGTFGGNFGAVFALGRPELDADLGAFDDDSYAGQWTLHVGEYIEIAGAAGTTDIRNLEYPETIKLGTGVVFLTTAASVAYTPTKWLAIGFQLDIYKGFLDSKTLPETGGGDSLQGSPRIAGVPIPGNPTYNDFLGLFDTGEVGDPSTYFASSLYSLQLGFTLSTTVRPTENFAIGFSYAPRSLVVRDFEGKAKVDVTRTFQNSVGGLSETLRDLVYDTLPERGRRGLVSNYDVKITGIRVPRRLRANFAWWPIPRLLISAEVSWVEWARALQIAFVELRNGSNTDINFVLGSADFKTKIPLRVSNQWIFSVHTVLGLTDWFTLRAGFNYGRNAINVRETGNSPSAGFVENHLLMGFGIEVSKGLELGVLAEYGFRINKRNDNSPKSLTARGTRYSAEQFFLHFGLSYRF